MTAAWSDTGSQIVKTRDGYSIVSGEKSASYNQSINFSFYHYLHYQEGPTAFSLNFIQNRHASIDERNSISYWKRWFKNVDASFSLAHIKDTRARNIVEGGITVIEANRCIEGGIVGNETVYNLSWTRDAYCGLRALLALGHTNESKEFIRFLNRKYLSHRFIPNAVSCGSDIFALYNGNRENNPNRSLGIASPCPPANSAAETPALLILAARDYYQATHDLKTLSEADSSLRYSMDIQLKYAIMNGYKLEFSGDETELCGAVNALPAGYDRNLVKFWSMSSMALCIASLEFYIDYLNLKKQDPTHYRNSQDGKKLNLKTELENLKLALDKDFWRTNVSGRPRGFYEWARIKEGNQFPPARMVNFSLFPTYYKVNVTIPDRLNSSVLAMASYYEKSHQKLPLIPGAVDGGILGHSLGYLLWGLVSIKNSRQEEVYHALIDGNTVQCWGTFNEAYDAQGNPNDNNLRTFETGVNIDAIAKYWKLGEKNK